MIANIKCLGPVLSAIAYILFISELCECKPNIDLSNVEDDLETGDNEFPAGRDPALQQELDNEASKRAWANFNSWGKRAWDKNFSVWGKRRWENFASWGKRSPNDHFLTQTNAQSYPVKRDWSNFASWGKRAEGDLTDEDMDKRWSNFHTWGKRNPEDIRDAIEADKKWSKFAAWGKRDDDQMEAEKRKWASFNTWGKRSGTDEDADKRQWSQFASWGKRGLGMVPQYQTEHGTEQNIPTDKRKWSQFASWGKRLRNANRWAALNTWGKRRWSGLVTWGKRSSGFEEPQIKDIAQTFLTMFDTNGDGTLDLQEITSYLQTLQTLPSQQDVLKHDVQM